MRRVRQTASAAVLLTAAALPGTAVAQAAGAADGAADTSPTTGAASTTAEQSGRETVILAPEIAFEHDSKTFIAKGGVEITSEGRQLVAREVRYDTETDVMYARGDVSILETDGTVYYFEEGEITGDLKAGVGHELRIRFADQSRLASREAERREGNISELTRVGYTACDNGCDGGGPLWQLKANRVVHYQDDQLISYRSAWLELFGVPVFYTPYMSHPDPTVDRKSGFLTPSIAASKNMGFTYIQPYYIVLSDYADTTVSPLLTTTAGQGVKGEYRQRFRWGELTLTGSIVGNDKDPLFQQNELRGHLQGKFRADLTSDWRMNVDVHVASDETYLRRYGFYAPTWLTTSAEVERFDTNSYFSMRTFFFQSQRRTVASGTTPRVAPQMTFTYKSDPMWKGSFLTFDADAVSLTREVGADSHRLSVAGGWHMPYASPSGFLYTLRTSVRGDVYYVDNVDVGTPNLHDGFESRFVPQASLEVRYPLMATWGKTRNVMEPIAQIVATPNRNTTLAIPNEDSLDFEFDETNLFSDSRFSGYDRIDDGVRVNYGVRWSTYLENGGSIVGEVGQSYAFDPNADVDPLSGIATHFSDIVGRVQVRPVSWASLQYRFRLDNSNFKPRRNEISATIGPDPLRVTTSYVFVKQGGAAGSVFDDREEIYVRATSKLDKNWRIWASHRHNLGPGTDRGAIATGGGMYYEDECFAFGLDVVKDNTSDRDFQSGVSVLFRFNLKTIGEVNLSSEQRFTQ